MKTPHLTDDLPQISPVVLRFLAHRGVVHVADKDAGSFIDVRSEMLENNESQVSDPAQATASVPVSILRGFPAGSFHHPLSGYGRSSEPLRLGIVAAVRSRLLRAAMCHTCTGSRRGKFYF
jgi:hypothetical protein